MHKTITISEEAYNALKKARKYAKESFTDVIIRIFKPNQNMRELQDWVKKTDFGDLVSSIEKAYNDRKGVKLRN
jgi:predicted CopG family antitoxin